MAFPKKVSKTAKVPPAGKPPHPRGVQTPAKQAAMNAGAPVGGMVPGAPLINPYDNGGSQSFKNGGHCYADGGHVSPAPTFDSNRPGAAKLYRK